MNRRKFIALNSIVGLGVPFMLSAGWLEQVYPTTSYAENIPLPIPVIRHGNLIQEASEGQFGIYRINRKVYYENGFEASDQDLYEVIIQVGESTTLKKALFSRHNVLLSKDVEVNFVNPGEQFLLTNGKSLIVHSGLVSCSDKQVNENQILYASAVNRTIRIEKPSIILSVST